MVSKLKKPEAWTFSGKVKDRGYRTPLPVCHICARPTRYVCEVKHKDYVAEVGPECVLRCRILPQDGETQTEARERTKLTISKYKKEARRNRLVSIILHLKKKHPALNFGHILSEVRQDHSLSPAQAAFLLSLISSDGLSCDRDLLKVALNKEKHRLQYQNLANREKIILLDYASGNKKRIMQELQE